MQKYKYALENPNKHLGLDFLFGGHPVFCIPQKTSFSQCVFLIMAGNCSPKGYALLPNTATKWFGFNGDKKPQNKKSF
jgi:hypothetical protein